MLNRQINSSSTKLKSLYNQTLNYKEFMSDFLKMFFSFDIENTLVSGIDSNKKLLIVISSKEKYTTNLDQILFDDICAEWSDKKEELDVYCIGTSSFNFFTKNGFNVVGYSEIIENFDDLSLLSLYDYINTVVEKREYMEMHLCFNSFKTIISKKSTKFDLLSLSQENIHDLAQEVSIKLENSYLNPIANNIILGIEQKNIGYELFGQLFQYLIYGAILQSETAWMIEDNGTQKNKKLLSEENFWLDVSFNEAYQQLITKELQKITIDRA